MKRVRFALVALVVSLGLLLGGAPRAATPPVAPKSLELGSGPTIVILHELGGSRTTWLPTVRRLMSTHHVVLVDLPGHGDSPLPDPFSLEAVAAAVDQVLAKQNGDSTIVVGKGAGAAVLLHALAAQPQRARGIVMIDAGLKPPMAISDQQRRQFDAWIDSNYDSFLRMVYGSAGRDSAEGVAIRAQAALVPPITIKSYFRTMLSTTATDAFAKVHKPKLFIATDQMFRGPPGAPPPMWGEVVRTLGFPDSTAIPMRRIRNAGHLVMRDQPDSLAAAIREFSAKAMAR